MAQEESLHQPHVWESSSGYLQPPWWEGFESILACKKGFLYSILTASLLFSNIHELTCINYVLLLPTV